MIKKHLSAVDDHFDYTVYKAHEGILPDSIDECDGYMITGSRCSVVKHDELWINQLIGFVAKLHKAKIKTIGICFGHQVIAEATGGKVERADCGWQIGVHEFTICEPAWFMQPAATSFYVPMFCEDQVGSLGSDATVLAKGKCCEFGLVLYGEHMLTIQGHPEFSKAFAKGLLNVRQDEFPSKRYEIGSASFAQNTIDSMLIFQWFAQFLTQAKVPRQPDDNPFLPV